MRHTISVSTPQGDLFAPAAATGGTWRLDCTANTTVILRSEATKNLARPEAGPSQDSFAANRSRPGRAFVGAQNDEGPDPTPAAPLWPTRPQWPARVSPGAPPAGLSPRTRRRQCRPPESACTCSPGS